jgi:hypothetical protein
MKRRPLRTQKLLPVLQGAVDYTSQRVQAPVEIALVGALCCLAAVFQGIAKVRDPNGNPHPLSLHGYVGADSGDGKSPTMSILTREIREFDDEFERARSNFENRRLARDLLFASNVKTLTKEIAKLKARGKDTAHLEGQLERAMIFAEHRVYAPRFLCADASSASIISLLRHRFPFALLGEDEGDIVFNSGVFENTGLMIKLWDEMRYTFDRAHQSFELRAGVTVFVAIQRRVLWELLSSKARRRDLELGKFARGIWSFPESIQGERDFSLPSPDEALITPYNTVLRTALNKYRDGLPTPSLLELSPEARFWLKRYQKAVEKQLLDGGLFCEMRPQANKSALIALRLAGILHMSEGLEGPISDQTARVAVDLAAFFLWEYRCQFCPLTEVERHAALLTEAIHAFFEDNPISQTVPRRHFLRNADPAIRHVKTLDPAANYLEKMGQIRLQRLYRGTWTLSMWPDHDASPPVDPLLAGRGTMSPGRQYGPVRPDPPQPEPFHEGMIWPGVSLGDL